ncbi:hypothetical protein CDAR_271261 [Caerostris darwini]|uniref:Uncharacterized protein n=1 Tax=Caerostris darwini TaxID=1538125 RepID=A0AAV4TE52_9ARAC|nr:hypothetical protein CDAR_271261 [Caerostris darwini]
MEPWNKIMTNSIYGERKLSVAFTAGGQRQYRFDATAVSRILNTRCVYLFMKFFPKITTSRQGEKKSNRKKGRNDCADKVCNLAQRQLFPLRKDIASTARLTRLIRNLITILC